MSLPAGKNVLIILGHSGHNTFSAALADTYAQAARAAGHTVRMLHLADLKFDPLLHGSNPHHQPLERHLRLHGRHAQRLQYQLEI